jgi:hypothetical protein
VVSLLVWGCGCIFAASKVFFAATDAMLGVNVFNNAEAVCDLGGILGAPLVAD